MSQETLRKIIRKILIVIFRSKFPSHILVSVTIYDQLLQPLATYKELTVICFHQESNVFRGEKALGAIVIAVYKDISALLDVGLSQLMAPITDSQSTACTFKAVTSSLARNVASLASQATEVHKGNGSTMAQETSSRCTGDIAEGTSTEPNDTH